MTSKITQEYVNENVDEIVEFMKKSSPGKGNPRQWKQVLLKDYKPKLMWVVAYESYSEGIAIRNRYFERMDKNFIREELLNKREEMAKHGEKNYEAKVKECDTWRQITQHLKTELISVTSESKYDEFIEETTKYHPHFGL